MHFAAIIICCVHGLSYGSTSDVVSQQISDLGRVKAYPDLNGAIFEHMPTNAIEMASGPPQTQDQVNYGQTIGQVLALLSLLVLSGLFAGLGLGLMSLNLTELKILAEVGDDNEASLDEIKRGKAAKSIITIRSKGHLLLTTLLLGSVAVNSLASIVAADLTTGVWGFLVSTALIVIFGEIIPQSLCSKYAVEIGGKSVPFVRFVILLFYVVARPVSMILDHFLGTETDTLLTNNQMRQLIQIHGEEGIIDGDENQLLLAALTHHDRIATDIMTKNDRIYRISISAPTTYYLFDVAVFSMLSLTRFCIHSQAVITTTLLQELRQRGFSRVPIFDESPDDIIGILYLKDLILLDPAKETAVIDVIQRRKRNIVRVDGSCSLNALLEKFKSIGRSSILVEEPKAMKETRGASRLLGIVTMSDVVNALLPGISREKEKKNLAQLSVRSSKSAQHSEWDLNADGMIAVETLAKQLQLSDNIFSAVTSSGSKLSINQLANFLANCEIVHYNANGSDEIILRRNEEISYSLLLLHGRVRMAKGSEIEQDCEIGSVFALDCLKMQDEAYLTDFELKTVPNVSTKCLQIPRVGFRNLLRNDESSPPM
ncbi:unnamed protein product [Albugo candida]|uniref:CNNM transmembrane domain-containing protein n=1 Tax=Albugo candida TaxID=65357 RepID=A0A024GF21_9STRA|nr:unnamed protein product [Albugo candida]|eukprot:CCI45140.1 unnamed protein product [Albugo candida]